jgi:ubiquinone/menaquinone biosynthesis C-methylase UbiE
MDRVSYDWMLKLGRVQPHDRVLDVATGPGFIALLFAEHAQHVTGIDLTRALLTKAKAFQHERGIKNVNFLEGDGEFLPFAEGTFDLVTCHKAFHHFPRPERVLAEIYRVLKSGGRLVLGDTLSSEDLEKSELHNRLERMRDASHVKMYPLSELRKLIEGAGFEIEDVAQFHDERTFETWMTTITPPAKIIEKIKKIMLESVEDDRTGQRLRVQNGTLYYTRFAAVVSALKK